MIAGKTLQKDALPPLDTQYVSDVTQSQKCFIPKRAEPAQLSNATSYTGLRAGLCQSESPSTIILRLRRLPHISTRTTRGGMLDYETSGWLLAKITDP